MGSGILLKKSVMMLTMMIMMAVVLLVQLKQDTHEVEVLTHQETTEIIEETV